MLSTRHTAALLAGALVLVAASTAEAKPAWSLVYNEMNSGNAIMAVDAVDATHAFAVGITSQNGNSSAFGIKTEDGTTWDKIMLPSGYMIAMYTSIAFVDGNVGYLGGFTGKGGRVWKSDSAGVMWSEVVALSTNDTVMQLQAFPTGEMFAAAGSTMVAFDGTEFVKATPQIADGLGMTAVRMLNPTCGFAAATKTDGEESAVYFTSDGGKSWTQKGSSLSATIGKMWFVSPTLGWAAATKGGAGVVMKTTDGGATWSDQAIPPHPKVNNGAESPATDCFDVRFFDDKRGVAACAACTGGCGGGEGETPSWISIFVRTEDGGATWTMDPDYEAVMLAPPFGAMAKFSGLFYLSFPDPNNGYLGGTNNLLLRYVAETPEAEGWGQASCQSGGAGSGAGGSGAGGSAGTGPGSSAGESSDDGGCGCRAAGGSGAHGVWALAAMALLIGLKRRKR